MQSWDTVQGDMWPPLGANQRLTARNWRLPAPAPHSKLCCHRYARSSAQNAELYRRRALDAIEKINCLQEFAHARDPSSLPPLFHDDSRLAEAAVSMGASVRCGQQAAQLRL